MWILLGLLLILPPVSAEEQQFEYLQEFEGLHITGKPFDFDMKTYRLTVTGKVERPIGSPLRGKWTTPSPLPSKR